MHSFWWLLIRQLKMYFGRLNLQHRHEVCFFLAQPHFIKDYLPHEQALYIFTISYFFLNWVVSLVNLKLNESWFSKCVTLCRWLDYCKHMSIHFNLSEVLALTGLKSPLCSLHLKMLMLLHLLMLNYSFGKLNFPKQVRINALLFRYYY